MKKLMTTLGAIATTSFPLATTISCGGKDTMYFYEIFMEPINPEIRELNISIFHLPTHSDNEISEDFTNEYRRRLYSDLGQRLDYLQKTLLIDTLNIEYSSVDYVDEGGMREYSVDLLDTEKFPFAPFITIPAHVAKPGEYIIEVDENGMEQLVEATVTTQVEEKVFFLQTFQQLFSEKLEKFISKDSLLLTTPTTDSISPNRWSWHGYLIKTFIFTHREQI